MSELFYQNQGKHWFYLEKCNQAFADQNCSCIRIADCCSAEFKMLFYNSIHCSFNSSQVFIISILSLYYQGFYMAFKIERRWDTLGIPKVALQPRGFYSPGKSVYASSRRPCTVPPAHAGCGVSCEFPPLEVGRERHSHLSLNTRRKLTERGI